MSGYDIECWNVFFKPPAEFWKHFGLPHQPFPLISDVVSDLYHLHATVFHILALKRQSLCSRDTNVNIPASFAG